MCGLEPVGNHWFSRMVINMKNMATCCRVQRSRLLFVNKYCSPAGTSGAGLFARRYADIGGGGRGGGGGSIAVAAMSTQGIVA